MCIHSSSIPASMCSVCTPIKMRAIKRAVIRRTPKGVPTWSQWLRFRATRPLVHQRLCILCLQALDMLCGIHKPGRPDTDTIKLGCRVKITETTKFIVCNAEYEERTTKILPVVISGLGCYVCQYFYSKAESLEMGRYVEASEAHMRDLMDPRKRQLFQQYGCDSPSKRQTMIDVSELVLAMDRTPIHNHAEQS